MKTTKLYVAIFMIFALATAAFLCGFACREADDFFKMKKSEAQKQENIVTSDLKGTFDTQTISPVEITYKVKNMENKEAARIAISDLCAKAKNMKEVIDIRNNKEILSLGAVIMDITFSTASGYEPLI